MASKIPLLISSRRVTRTTKVALALALAPALAPATLRAQQSTTPAAAQWWHTVTVLAADSMHGRYTGSDDYVKAARYVAQQFAALGLQPGGSGNTDFFQVAHLASATLITGRSGIVLERGGRVDTLQLGRDATVQFKPTTEASAEGPLVFVGYGLHLPGTYDDLAHVDLHGKVAVYLNRMPQGLSATMFAHGRASRWGELQRLGAVAAIAIANPAVAGRAGAAPPGGTPPRLRPVIGLAADPANRGILINVNADAAERLFAGSGHTYAGVIALSDAHTPLPTVSLEPRLRASLEIDRKPVDSPNVVGILHGTDPALRDQYLVVSAHLDHLGFGRPVNGDSLYNGAMDNASGVATLIETARAFHDRNMHPRRSIIFLAVTGEEEGELGSAYFATHPTVPAAQIVADLNTDMFLPIIPLKGVFAYGVDESDLGKDVESVLKTRGLANIPDPEPAQVRFIRSDQYSFIQRGIPAMAFKAGYTNDSPEMKTVSEWLANRYHKPSDDLAQPVNLQCAADFDGMYFEIVRAVADRPTRPAWYSQSVFAS
ncbi:MAG: M28 family peptidase, partial [Gemmatimonadaceae bacterium]